jgi:flagellar biosynthesis protein
VAAALSAGNTSKLPKVVASGYGHVAEEILALAFANGVKVREDGDLASLLAALDLDSEIPLEVLHTVSEILARVYEANGHLSRSDETDQE